MAKKNALARTMSLEEFETGYWYAVEIKRFAVELGIAQASRLRKDQLEEAIRAFLRTGKLPAARPPARGSGPTDLELGLSLDLAVVRYTSNRATKDFLHREALKIAPGLKKKSGARYRLNRWRDDQLARGVPITYADLVRRYVELNQGEERFARIPVTRYINFLAEFLESEDGATRADGIRAWKGLKELPIPKSYRAWKEHRRAQPARSRGAGRSARRSH